jgi:tetratricopeptide (TPR) repeat protein
MMDTKMAEVVHRSEEMLSDAVASFRQLVIEAKNPAQTVLRNTRLANALQNLASISAMYASDFDATNTLLEEAVTLYMSCLNNLDASNPERKNVISGVAQSLYSLSDGYLQAAKYEQAKFRYRDTVNWYKIHNLGPPAVSDLPIMDADGALESAEQALQEYTTMLYGGGELQIPNDNTRRGEAIYEADELYEADLHATLGTLRMARNEMHLAVIHLAEAIERYGRNPESGRSLADAKLNLAMAYFKQGEYELSIEAHEDALDDYKRVVREGQNPLFEGFEDLLETQGLNRDTLKGGAGAGARDTNLVIDVSAYQASILNRTAASKDEL